MRGFRLAAIAAVIIVSGTSGIRAQSRIGWVEDLAVARQMARQQQRLLLIHFWSNSCPPCLRLERYVFNQPEVIRAIHSNYIPVKINATEKPRVASLFHVNRWPTDIIATVDGREVYRGVSQQDPNRYIAVLDQVAANTRVGFPVSGPASTATAKVPSPGNASRSSSFPAQNSLANNSSSRPDQRGNSARIAPPQQKSAAQKPAPPQYVSNRYVGAQTPGVPATTPSRTAPMAPAYGDRYSVPPTTQPNPSATQANAPSSQLASSSNAPNGPAMPSPSAGRAASVGAPSSPYGANKAPANRADVPARNPAPQTASGNPPLGLDGYCPVTLVEKQKWVKGDPRWGAIHEGRTYLFAGPEEQKRFLAQFDKYAPVLSGCDPVKFVETGKLVPGQRAHGVFYRDQIYLFVDEASLQQFWSAPERYALAVLAARQKQQGRQTTQR